MTIRTAANRPMSRAEWGLPAWATVLCGFHQAYKISAAVFDEWCRLLHELPNAVLWLLQWNGNVQATLTAAAAERGIGPGRLVFAPLLPLQDHLSRLACADVFLDAWPCNAHTTAGEALWCGVPVVTLQGATFAQRVASSLLHAVDLDELVSDSVDGFRREVEAAGLRLQLARSGHHPAAVADPDRLAQVVANLTENALKYASGSITLAVIGDPQAPRVDGMRRGWRRGRRGEQLLDLHHRRRGLLPGVEHL